MGSIFGLMDDVKVRIVLIIALVLYAGYDFRAGMTYDTKENTNLHRVEIAELRQKVIEMKLQIKELEVIVRQLNSGSEKNNNSGNSNYEELF